MNSTRRLYWLGGLAFIGGVLAMSFFFVYPFFRVEPTVVAEECSRGSGFVTGANAAVCGGKTVATCECRGNKTYCEIWCGNQRNGCDIDEYGDCTAEFTIAKSCTSACKVNDYTNESIPCGGGGPTPPSPPPPCVPGACTGCTPSCPSGQTKTDTGPYCETQKSSCTGNNGCTSCTKKGAMCYKPETNVAPNPVSDIQFCTGTSTNCTTISKNSSSPTIVVNDNASDPVYLKALGGVIPSGSNSRGLRYRWQLDYLGDSYNCANTYDACQNVDTDNISSDVKGPVVEGYTYKITYWVGTLDRCDDDIKWSTAVSAYFTVDYTPQIVGALLNGQSGTEIDTDNGPNCGPVGDNNPFTLSVRYRDLDGVDELRVIGFWTDDAWPNRDLAPVSVHGYVRVNGGGASYTALGYSCVDGCGWKVDGGALPASDKVLCSVDGLNTDLLASDPRCEDETGAWTVTSIQVLSATDVRVNYKLWIDDDIGDNLDHYIYARDIHGANTRWVDRGDWIHDKEAPVATLSDELTIIGSNNVSLDWSVTDNLTGVAEIRGAAELITAGLKESPIDDDTSGVTNYKIDGTETRDLWLVNNPVSRTEEIDLKANEGNQIGFKAYSVDNVCNQGESPVTAQQLDSPWVTTKGGYVYSDNGTVLNTRSLELPSHLLTNDPVIYPDIWRYPFRIQLGDLDAAPQNNDIALSTELYLIGATSNFEVLDSNNNPAQGPSVSNVGGGYGNNIYKTVYDGVLRKAQYETSVSPIPVSSTTWTGDISSQNGCSATDGVCIFHSTSDLTVESTDLNNPFVCNVPSIILVEGNLELWPDIIRGTDALDGCVFVVGGDVTVNQGVDHTNPTGCNTSTITDDEVCYPPYDRVDAMVVTDGQITLEPDPEDLLNEGLLVRGSLLGLGSTADPGILWQRSLKLVNNVRFPSLVVHYDAVYLGIVNRFTDMPIDAYIQEVGYKSY